jgi:hypothetical protein
MGSRVPMSLSPLDALVIDDPLAVAGRDVVATAVVGNFRDLPKELANWPFWRRIALVVNPKPRCAPANVSRTGRGRAARMVLVRGYLAKTH